MSIEPGLVVEGDDRLLRVLLENLLGNAWKLTSKRSEACIEFGAVDEEENTVQRVIHRHHGRVWAEAAPDEGATFFFTVADHGEKDGE